MFQVFSQFKPSRKLLITCLILPILLLDACSSRPKMPTPEEQAEKLAAAMDKGGYGPARSLPIDNIREVWTHDNQELEIVMTVPTESGKYPLIIYLPSLGEDAKAGRLWRENWAKAGYAVFSMQPLAIGQALKELQPERGNRKEDDDNQVLDDEEDKDKEAKDDEARKKGGMGDGKPTRSARSSELRFLGHEYFAVDALKNRMEQLFWTYRQLQTRAGLNAPLFAAADFSKVVLAGYDLGAQTVTAVLGENFLTGLPQSNELNPVAAIILSPSIDLAEGNIRTRFQKLNLPLLVITGSEDNDPYAISSASVRSAVWEFSPPGTKYLLLLTGGVHPLLAGSDMGGRFGMNNGKGGDDGGHGLGLFGGGRFAQDSNQNGLGGGSRFGLGGNQNGLGGTSRSGLDSNQYGGGGHHGGSGGNNNWGLGGKGGEKKNVDLGYKQVAAVFSTTTAFLDKQVKGDEFAKFWLEDKSNQWLDSVGELKLR